MKDVCIIILFLLFLVMSLVALYFYSDNQAWHDKHQQLLDTLTAKLAEKDKEIDELKQMLNTHQKVIKIEQVHAEPREYTCKFPVHERFIDDSETFKKICISEVARYMAEELEKDQTAYKLYFEKNAWTDSNNVMIKFRLLPYPEGLMNFDEIIDKTFNRQRRIENNEGH